MRLLDQVLDMGSGYVLNFSDKTISEYFEDEFGIDIDAEQYRSNGSSKAKRLRCFLEKESGPSAGRVLRSLWNYRAALRERNNAEQDPPYLERQFFEVVARIEGDTGGPSITDAIERFEKDETLDELVASIERDIGANKPEVALDRLHTYCMKKFAHLLRMCGEEPGAKETLNARAGRYFNPLRKKGVRPITDKIMKSSVEMLELYNSIRNNESLAHDNKLVDPVEARFIFDSVVSMLRFLKAHEPARFGS
jgi:hypothetical protein